MSLMPQATVADIVSEFNGQSFLLSGTFTLFNVGGVTSGQIYDKITEANMTLQSWVSLGSNTNPNPFQKEQIKRFEVAYGSARMAADLLGIVITDGFNYSEGGVSVQRQAAIAGAYKEFIDDHLMIAKEYIKAFHQWFWVYNPTANEGYNNNGTPVGYWSTSWGGPG
jgi:hypothetical protein